MDQRTNNYNNVVYYLKKQLFYYLYALFILISDLFVSVY